jgi:hypothetical protein
MCNKQIPGHKIMKFHPISAATHSHAAFFAKFFILWVFIQINSVRVLKHKNYFRLKWLRTAQCTAMTLLQTAGKFS